MQQALPALLHFKNAIDQINVAPRSPVQRGAAEPPRGCCGPLSSSAQPLIKLEGLPWPCGIAFQPSGSALGSGLAFSPRSSGQVVSTSTRGALSTPLRCFSNLQHSLGWRQHPEAEGFALRHGPQHQPKPAAAPSAVDAGGGKPHGSTPDPGSRPEPPVPNAVSTPSNAGRGGHGSGPGDRHPARRPPLALSPRTVAGPRRRSRLGGWPGYRSSLGQATRGEQVMPWQGANPVDQTTRATFPGSSWGRGQRILQCRSALGRPLVCAGIPTRHSRSIGIGSDAA